MTHFVVAYTFRFDVVCIHLGLMFMLLSVHLDVVFVVVFEHDRLHSFTVDIISFRFKNFRCGLIFCVLILIGYQKVLGFTINFCLVPV